VDAVASSLLEEEDEDDIVRAVVVVVPFPSSEQIGVGVGDVVCSLLLLSSSLLSTLLVDSTTSVPVPISASSCPLPLVENEILGKMMWVGALRRRPQTSRHAPSSPLPPSTTPLLPVALDADAASWNDDDDDNDDS